MTADGVIKVEWDSGIVAYLDPVRDRLATKAREGGWNIRETDAGAYLNDVGKAEPPTERTPIDESPFEK